MAKTTVWISCYIFHNISFDRFLIENVKPLVDEFNSKKLLELFFFVRYWEKGQHIRLRILPTSDIVKDILIELIQNNTAKYFEKIGQDYSIEFNDYIHELQRYGGVDNIRISQKHFNDSSHMVLNHIFQAENWDYSLAISSAIQLHLVFAKQMITREQDAILYFETLYKSVFRNSVKSDNDQRTSSIEILKVKNFFMASYKKQEKVIKYILNSIWLGKIENTWITNWSLNCIELSEAIKNKHRNNKISPPDWFELNPSLNISLEKQILWSIYDSYIHMTNNRLGIFLRDEAFIAFIILNGLKSMDKYKN